VVWVGVEGDSVEETIGSMGSMDVKYGEWIHHDGRREDLANLSTASDQ
jgi:hypothetical protein